MRDAYGRTSFELNVNSLDLRSVHGYCEIERDLDENNEESTSLWMVRMHKVNNEIA